MKLFLNILFILLLSTSQAFAHSSDLPASPTVDSTGAIIDPATEGKQDTIIVDTGVIAGDTTSIDGKIPSDPSTVTEQDQTQALIGEVQATPTENTVLDRLKDLLDAFLAATVSNGTIVNIHNADFHVVPVNRRFANFPGTNTTTLASNAASQDTVITIQNADMAGYTVGDWLYIADGTTEETEFMQITIKGAAPPNTLTLDRPLDNAYDSATTTIEEVIVNMVADGSLAAPVSFKLIPAANEVLHITRHNLTAVTANASASDDFLSIDALTNGVVLRTYISGVYKTWTNWKSDSDITSDQYDLDNVPTAPAAGAGQRGRWWLKRADVIMKLVGANGDYAEYLIQDDLTGEDLSIWYQKGQGHLEGT